MQSNPHLKWPSADSDPNKAVRPDTLRGRIRACSHWLASPRFGTVAFPEEKRLPVNRSGYWLNLLKRLHTPLAKEWHHAHYHTPQSAGLIRLRLSNKSCVTSQTVKCGWKVKLCLNHVKHTTGGRRDFVSNAESNLVHGSDSWEVFESLLLQEESGVLDFCCRFTATTLPNAASR